MGRLALLEIVVTQLMGGCISLVQNVQAKGPKDAASKPRGGGVEARCARRKTGAGGDVYGVRHEPGARTHRHHFNKEASEHNSEDGDTEGRRDVDEKEEKATVSGRRDGDSATDTIDEIGVLEAEDDPRVDIRWSCGELIGAGAFGRVYMGMNLESGELMAVKQVSMSECEVSRREDHVRALENEVAVLRRLRHVNIVRYLGTERTDDTLNIFLEYVPGGSIHSLLVKFGSFGESVVRRYTRQILNGLHFLHKNQIVHRDIKGANILVDNTGVVKLADFGASKQIANLVTLDDNIKSIKGTPFWMAPEVIRQTGHGRQADVWSVGCTVIEMATGKAPWSQFTNQVSVMFHIASSKAPPPIPEHLSEDGKAFLRACLQRNPRDRATSTMLLEYAWMKDCDPKALLKSAQRKKTIARIESTASSTTDMARARNNAAAAAAPPTRRSAAERSGEETGQENEGRALGLNTGAFGLSPVLSQSIRYSNSDAEQQEESQQSDSGGWGSIDMDEIDCGIVDASSVGTSDDRHQRSPSRPRDDMNAKSIMDHVQQHKSGDDLRLRADDPMMETPTSRQRDEDDIILDYVREKAEGDCERLAPRNPDGSPMLLSSSSPNTSTHRASETMPRMLDVAQEGEEKENESPASPSPRDTSLRQSKEQMWEEELRRELEAERQQLSLRQ